MSAILQPGDVIQIAVPIQATAGGPDLEATEAFVAQVIKGYERLGVGVSYWSASTLCPNVTVVSILRKPILIPIEEKK